MYKSKVAIIGSGNIGTDLMIKVMRVSKVLEMGAFVGIDSASPAYRDRIEPAGMGAVRGTLRQPPPLAVESENFLPSRQNGRSQR